MANKRVVVLRKRVDEQLDARGYKTQAALARHLHISPAYMSMILSGRRRPLWPLAKRLASATGIEVEAFMDAPSAQQGQL